MPKLFDQWNSSIFRGSTNEIKVVVCRFSRVTLTLKFSNFTSNNFRRFRNEKALKSHIQDVGNRSQGPRSRRGEDRRRVEGNQAAGRGKETK